MAKHLVSRFPHVTKVSPTSAADANHHCYLTLVFHYYTVVLFGVFFLESNDEFNVY